MNVCNLFVEAHELITNVQFGFQYCVMLCHVMSISKG